MTETSIDDYLRCQIPTLCDAWARSARSPRNHWIDSTMMRTEPLERYRGPMPRRVSHVATVPMGPSVSSTARYHAAHRLDPRGPRRADDALGGCPGPRRVRGKRRARVLLAPLRRTGHNPLPRVPTELVPPRWPRRQRCSGQGVRPVVPGVQARRPAVPPQQAERAELRG